MVHYGDNEHNLSLHVLRRRRSLHAAVDFVFGSYDADNRLKEAVADHENKLSVRRPAFPL